MYPTLKHYIQELLPDVTEIHPDRREVLEGISRFVSEKTAEGKPANLVFICTHNSRRSHFGQIWAKVMAAHFGIKGVETFSGGTEATAFNANAIHAIISAGFEVSGATHEQNPVYNLRYSDSAPPLEAFSKVYSHPTNPQEDFCAVMTCSDADQNCPYIPGATLRIATPYEDPKAFDGTDQEEEKYAERCKQIATEMAYVMQKVYIHQ